MTETLFDDFKLADLPVKNARKPELKPLKSTPCSESPELFAPKTATESLEARAICSGCPLKANGSCLKLGRAMRGYGIWGGEFLWEGRTKAFRPIDDDEF